jgi:hypothetical protein
MHKQISARLSSGLVLASALLAGCASAPERPRGAVVPMAGGQYQSSVKAPDTTAAMKTFTHDAEVTCTKSDGSTRMPWQGKPAPGRYVVVSQTAKTKDGKKIESSDNKMLDAGIAVGLRKLNLEAQDAVEVSTVFKCE